jgi:hypothetical protein
MRWGDRHEPDELGVAVNDADSKSIGALATFDVAVTGCVSALSLIFWFLSGCYSLRLFEPHEGKRRYLFQHGLQVQT